MSRPYPIARLLVIASVFFLPFTEEAPSAADPLRQAPVSSMQVQGRIVDIGKDLIVVKTSTATYRLKKKTAPLNAALGDTVTLWVTSGHAVIDHHRQDTGRRHRFITGTLLDTASNRLIALWTPEGNRVYSLAEHATKTSQLPEGTMVTVEINEAGAVIEARPVETELSACDKRHHCKVMLHGTVKKIEGGMIFIQTPVVEYEIPTNIAPSDAAPGDEMTLWVNENDVVLNYHRAGEASHRRYVTGKLRYTDKVRSHIQLWTPEGERRFSLVHLSKARDLQEGRPVTLEISDAGTVIDFWQSS